MPASTSSLGRLFGVPGSVKVWKIQYKIDGLEKLQSYPAEPKFTTCGCEVGEVTVLAQKSETSSAEVPKSHVCEFWNFACVKKSLFCL